MKRKDRKTTKKKIYCRAVQRKKNQAHIEQAKKKMKQEDRQQDSKK